MGILFVMFSDVRRLNIPQNKRYGNAPEYVKTVPIPPPFLPLYSVHKWLVV